MVSTKVGIVNYESGNATSVINAIEFLGVPFIFSNNEKELEQCSHILLPGVGAFKNAMLNLDKHGLTHILNNLVRIQKKYFLGICVGMQILAKIGTEFEEYPGLGWIDSTCSILPTNLQLPHVGWNEVTYYEQNFDLFKGFTKNPVFYFVHSYAIESAESCKFASASYGTEFICAIQKDNIYGVQFHPEKSQKDGLLVLKNFCELM